MTGWLIAGAGLLAAALVVGAYRLTVRRYAPAPGYPGICFYLHEKHVMNLYLQGDYEALRQEVEDRFRTDTGTSLGAKVAGIHGRAGRDAEKERIIRYIREVGPITVIGRIVEELSRKGHIVHVDLLSGVLEPGEGTDRALRSAHRAQARLSDLSSFVFVSVTGRFQMIDKTDEAVVLAASYGDLAQVSLTCRSSQLLEDVPPNPFSARCLGRIQGWDPDTGRLVLDPVLAIYR